MKPEWLLQFYGALTIFSSFTHYADCSHFRGGIFMWKPTNTGTGSQVSITFRMAWRRSYSSATYCDQSTINQGGLIAYMGSISCFGCQHYIWSSTDVTMTNTSFVCTDYSIQEDWTQGERTFLYNFGNSITYFGFTGNAWISLVYGGGNWEMRTKVNLSVRADTGLINTSPTSAMPAIVRLQHGCDHNITIPVFDKDNDVIKCRWAKSEYNECGGVCSTFKHASLNENCEIRYSAIYQIGWYAVAIQIEDFASENSTTSLSSIPLQFLVNVFQSSKKCKNRPVFLLPTRQDGACVGVPYPSTWSEKIIAKASQNESISEINTVSPTGFKKSNLSRYDNSGEEWYVNVTWTPKANQAGEHPFCYTASDTDGLVSERICIELLVGVAPPEIVSLSPTHDVYPTLNSFTIYYDTMFVRPTRTTYFYVYTRNNTLVSKIDVSQDWRVTYPAASDSSFPWKLEIPVNFRLQEKEFYYIKMDPGVAKGTSGCGAESAALWNTRDWTFRVRE
ncbi:integrin beta-like protein C [Saccostrea cucullata]|uniref:integrin beta-like protein C n=1 Tax=Saccostrea cuccullata TaxID=36930 RepID=UPI002ED0BEEE